MNRIIELFNKKKENILNVYFTAGFPQLNDTQQIIESLQASGADIIEIGIPFSDPVADGPTIQLSNEKALKNGMTLKLLFSQLKNIREKVNIPIILMGYINPVIQFGIEEFCINCKNIGIDGVILPDLPIQEYINEYKSIFERYGIINNFLITPQTSESRINKIDEVSNGFIYMVSSSSITGSKADTTNDQIIYFKRILSMNLKSPRLIGFGISNRQTFQTACKYANGAIIGSAFISAIENDQPFDKTISTFINNIIQ